MGGQDACATAPEARSIMQALLADLAALHVNARANLEAAAGQRNRLLGDLPPTPERVAKDAASRIGGSVSFSDINAMIEELRNTLLATNEHLLSLRRIG